MLTAQFPQEEGSNDAHSHHRGSGRARQPPQMNENGYRDGPRDHASEGEVQRLSSILYSSHPAIAGHLNERERNSEGRDAQPLSCSLRGVRITGQPGGEDTREEPHEDRQNHADAHCNPRGLYTFGYCFLASSCTEQARRPCGRAIRKEGELGRDDRMQRGRRA